MGEIAGEILMANCRLRISGRKNSMSLKARLLSGLNGMLLCGLETSTFPSALFGESAEALAREEVKVRVVEDAPFGIFEVGADEQVE